MSEGGTERPKKISWLKDLSEEDKVKWKKQEERAGQFSFDTMDNHFSRGGPFSRTHVDKRKIPTYPDIAPPGIKPRQYKRRRKKKPANK